MRVPIATYRLQFGPSFGFQDAQGVIPYLSKLGISDVYASPILKATQGSTHGYDVTDPAELNPQLGTPEAFLALATARKAHGIGWLQDIVPNHMAYSSENAPLMDVFKNGAESEYVDWFDVFRDHPDPELRTKVLIPFLGQPLEDVLQEGQLSLAVDDDGLALRYYDWRLPLRLDSYDEVLSTGLDETIAALGDDARTAEALRRLCTGWTELSGLAPGPQRNQRVTEAQQEFLRLRTESDGVAAHCQRVLAFYNSTRDAAQRQSRLAPLIDRQWYKPVFWRTAGQTINYRRFFYLNDFIALRIERPEVFAAVHEKILELTRAGLVTGLRIDHIDGLYDPLTYLRRLRESVPDSYLVVEKILELEETLLSLWPIEGTSGYKFCNYVNGLFCDCGSEAMFTDIYHEFLGAEVDYLSLLYDAKSRILRKHMGGEVAYLGHLITDALGEGGQESVEPWGQALIALMAAFPVYRTYIDAEQFSDRDRVFITAAVLDAKRRAPDHQEYIDRIGRLLLSYQPLATPSTEQDNLRYIAMRFQQFTGPAMAKGLEDTLFYTYNRFISLNEVGGDPDFFGIPLDRFHRFNEMRARHWPHAMNATSTHDAKRGEDIRARLNVLSEMPERWRKKVERWAQINADHKQICNGGPAPDANDEYFLYQTLVGALPFVEREFEEFQERLRDYMVKVLREAKRHTTWSEPNEPYERACLAFIDRIMDADGEDTFWSDFLPFQQEVAAYGIYNSLSQTTLKITCPGLPDFYQGTELWDLNLVDPDNRRPVDFAVREEMLELLETTWSDAPGDMGTQLLTGKEDGRVKLFLIHRLLQVRAAHRKLFGEGDYLALDVTGRWARHVVAFERVFEDIHVLLIVPRFLTTVIKPDELPVGRTIWGDTCISLPDKHSGIYQNVLTGERCEMKRSLPVARALATFPIAVFLGLVSTHSPLESIPPAHSQPLAR